MAIVKEEDAEIYVYGFYILYTYVLYFIITVLFSVLLGVVWESVLFYFLFMLIRGYAGGIHAKTETACMGLTTLSLLISVFGILLSSITAFKSWILIWGVLGSGSIIIFSPLESPEKPLEIEESQSFRRLSILLVSGYVVLGVLTYLSKIYSFAAAVAISLFLEGVLLVIGKMKQL